ncbi:unnamed protein product [Adineta ricciae]|uniref:Uncharacterized protein n=2 Tax=Adineta ricciae TaxID=249248 RepID=A0A814P381_ADIRI|nr:unnamed protein product [Adineta ricciae]
MPNRPRKYQPRKKFRCGRLVLNSNGTIKTVDLKCGGGTRLCQWRHGQMNFHDVHQELLKVYNLRHKQNQTYLYDFQRQRINASQYRTFREYINRNGLHGNNIVVYLCTHEDDDLPPPPSTTTTTTTNDIPPNEEESRSHEEPYKLSIEYSFNDSINELMQKARQLVDQDCSNRIHQQIYEKICVIYGYVFGIIIPLQQSFQRSDQLSTHLNQLNNICQTFESTKSLFHENRDNFYQLPLFVTVFNSFSQLYNNVQMLQVCCSRLVKRENVDASDINIEITQVESVSSTNVSCEEAERTLQTLVKQFNRLLSVVRFECTASFQELIASSIETLNSIESSIGENIHVLQSMRNQLKNELTDQTLLQPKTSSDFNSFHLCRDALVTLGNLIKLLKQLAS